MAKSQAELDAQGAFNKAFDGRWDVTQVDDSFQCVLKTTKDSDAYSFFKSSRVFGDQDKIGVVGVKVVDGLFNQATITIDTQNPVAFADKHVHAFNEHAGGLGVP